MNKNLKTLLDKPVTDVDKFHDKTKLTSFASLRSRKNWPKEWTTTYFKSYPRLDKIVLSEPTLSKDINLVEVLASRKTIRYFSAQAISLDIVSALLYFSAGIRGRGEATRRMYPSAGARYPLEVYLISLNSELLKGVYHYDLKSHSLELLNGIKKLRVRDYFLFEKSSLPGVIIIITAVFNRNMVKYGTRGYRHILAEVGHMAQNFYLVSAALNIGIYSIGGYLDNKINKVLLDIDDLSESVIYVMGVGCKK